MLVCIKTAQKRPEDLSNKIYLRSYWSVQIGGNQRTLEKTILLITSIYLRKTHRDQQHMKHSHVGSRVNKYTFLHNNTNTNLD